MGFPEWYSPLETGFLGTHGGRAWAAKWTNSLYLSLFFEQNVAIMLSFWGSALAKPRQHVGHGAQAKLKQLVNFGY